MDIEDWLHILYFTLCYTAGMILGRGWYFPILFGIGCIFGSWIFNLTKGK